MNEANGEVIACYRERGIYGQCDDDKVKELKNK